MKQPNITLCTIILSISIYSCNKEKIDTASDNALFPEIVSDGYMYYQDGVLLSSTPPSPHGDFKLRFNEIAQRELNEAGELPSESSFLNGSIIVKEIQKNSSISLYAVMKKDLTDKNAAGGWIWAEFYPDGSAAYSTGDKGKKCIGCHSGLPNRDLVKTFDLH